MAPRCVTSPYCLIELEYARLLGKRIIPINQMVIFDTPKQELSAGDKVEWAQPYENKWASHDDLASVGCVPRTISKLRSLRSRRVRPTHH